MLSIAGSELSGLSYRHMGNPKTVPLWKKAQAFQTFCGTGTGEYAVKVGGRWEGGLVRVQRYPHPLLLCGHSKPDLSIYGGEAHNALT